MPNFRKLPKNYFGFGNLVVSIVKVW